MESWIIGRGGDTPCDVILTSSTGKTSRRHALLSRMNPGSYTLTDTSKHGTTVTRENRERISLKNGETLALEEGDKIEFAGCEKVWSLQGLLVAAGGMENTLDFKKEFREQVKLWEGYMEFRNNERREQREYRVRKETFESRVKIAFLLIAGAVVAYLVFTHDRAELNEILENPRNYLTLVLTLPVFFTRVNGWIVGWFVPKLDHQKIHDDFDRQWRCPNPACKETEARSEYRKEGGAFKSPKELEQKKGCSKCGATWAE